jgi:hypothetical protein
MNKSTVGTARTQRGNPTRSVESVVLKSHKYSIGQTVRYIAGPISRVNGSGTFKVVKLLPPEGDEHQYRIKSTGEAFERVAKESQLDRFR